MNVGSLSTNTWSGQLRKRVEPGFCWFESNKIFWFIMPSFCTILLEHKHTTCFVTNFHLGWLSHDSGDDKAVKIVTNWRKLEPAPSAFFIPSCGNREILSLKTPPSHILRIWVLRQVVAPLYCCGSTPPPPLYLRKCVSEPKTWINQTLSSFHKVFESECWSELKIMLPSILLIAIPEEANLVVCQLCCCANCRNCRRQPAVNERTIGQNTSG